MNFTAIDFETANPSNTSACSVAVVEVHDGVIIAEKAWLIHPETWFSRFFIGIHGIHPAQVADAPNFARLWPELLPWIAGRHLVAHNMKFDRRVLTQSLKRYSLPQPEFTTSCTYQMAVQHCQDLPNRQLPTVAAACGVELSRHHDALADARACAGIAIWMQKRGLWS
ncbi:MAG: hypothetical protein RL095_850 [Verrucomicrobiota bacterium]|jgi:DNA polymerase-3 subunit epsilon